MPVRARSTRVSVTRGATRHPCLYLLSNKSGPADAFEIEILLDADCTGGEFCRQGYFMISAVNWKYSASKSPITVRVLRYTELICMSHYGSRDVVTSFSRDACNFFL